VLYFRPPLLTISIPTFNRLEFLKPLLEGFAKLDRAAQVEILVIDNHSSDGTWEWLQEHQDDLGLTLYRNPFNLGIEGNILQALIHATGTYVWLMSDHMSPYLEEINQFVAWLSAGGEFSVGYARIAQYSSVMETPYQPQPVLDLPPGTLTHMVFYISNISAFVVQRECILRSIRSGVRFAQFTYPHLGILAGLKAGDRVVELPPLSAFQTLGSRKYRLSYDTFRSRFIGFPKALFELRRLNSLFKKVKFALNVQEMVSALRYELMCRSVDDASPLPSAPDLLFILRTYPWRVRLLIMGMLILRLLPRSLNRIVSRQVFTWVAPKAYARYVREGDLKFRGGDILE
jgi:glycosyltransferase involved in cell wall biosynthesis